MISDALELTVSFGETAAKQSSNFRYRGALEDKVSLGFGEVSLVGVGRDVKPSQEC